MDQDIEHCYAPFALHLSLFCAKVDLAHSVSVAIGTGDYLIRSEFMFTKDSPASVWTGVETVKTTAVIIYNC